jgi:hypothetical protein
MSANLEELAASFNRAIQKMEGAQSVVNIARDRGDEAQRALAGTSDGSSSDQLGEALGAIANADQLLENALAAYVMAIGAVRAHMATRRLG